MINTFDKKSGIKMNGFVSLIPMQKDEDKIGNTVNYLDFLSYRQIGNEEPKEYIKEYYENVLSKLDPEELLSMLRYTVLVSDERSDSIAIRHIVSEWINLFCDEKTSEVMLKDGVVTEVERPEIIKTTLEEVIKSKNNDMKGFQTLRGLYLYEKSEKILETASRLEKLGKDCSEIKEKAMYLRGYALDSESRYRTAGVYVNRYMPKRYSFRRR